jgi:large subunit ribosomal protein L4
VSTTVSVVSPSGSGQDVELPGEIFSAPVNVPLIHQVVVAQEAAARQGTHATKTRGAVRGGGRKPYRQKGTGRARQGSLRAPQYAGGGTVHGPVPRSYEQRTPKKMKAAALRGALSDRASNGRVSVVTAFVEGEAPRTSEALAVLRTAIGLAEARLAASVLVVAESEDEVTWKSLRNVPGIRILATDQLNTYDVLASEHVVFTHAALSAFVGRVSPGSSVALEASPAPKRRTARAASSKTAAEAASEPAAEAPSEPAAEAASEPAAEAPSEPAAEAASEPEETPAPAKPRTRRASATPKEDDE